MDDFSIQYQGFTPSQFARRYVRDLIEKVHDESPSSSTVRVTISKVGQEAYKGIIRITSHAGPVFAIASGSKLVDVAHRLFERTRRQLERWKARRFTHESIRRPLHMVPKHSWKKSRDGGSHEDGSRAG